MAKRARASFEYTCTRCKREGALGEPGPFEAGGTHGEFTRWTQPDAEPVRGRREAFDLCERCSAQLQLFLQGAE